MRFVLKEEEPLFLPTVYIDRDDNSAGVNFVRFIQILQLSRRFQFLNGNGRHIH